METLVSRAVEAAVQQVGGIVVALLLGAVFALSLLWAVASILKNRARKPRRGNKR